MKNVMSPIDKKAIEYEEGYKHFQDYLWVVRDVFQSTGLAKLIEKVEEFVEEAYDINQHAGFLPEGDAYTDCEKFLLAIRFDTKSEFIKSLKNIPSHLKREFKASEGEFQDLMRDERAVLEQAFIDMEELFVQFEEDVCGTPDEIEELSYIFDEALEDDDSRKKFFSQVADNLIGLWEEFVSLAKSLIRLTIYYDDDIDTSMLPELLYGGL